MERIPELKWEKKTDYSTAVTEYFLQIRGIDGSGREYFYTGKIVEEPFKLVNNTISTVYSAGYSLFTDGRDFKLKPARASATFSVLRLAKDWIEGFFREQWQKDHN